MDIKYYLSVIYLLKRTKREREREREKDKLF